MAASSSPSSSSPCSNIIPQKKYDVFISFRSPDTRNNIVSHLDAALCRKNIKPFYDKQLRIGDEVLESLLNAIETSMVSIVIFSEGYAYSSWCLTELVKILECKNKYGRIVIPVFYHVHPSDVRKQTGSFGEGFMSLIDRQQRSQEELQIWRCALREACQIYGFELNRRSPEAPIIEEIVAEILKRLDGDTFPRANGNDVAGVPSTNDVSSSERIVTEGVEANAKDYHDSKLLSKYKKRTIAALHLVPKLFSYLAFEGVAFVLYLLQYLGLKAISLVWSLFSSLKCLVLEAILSVRNLFIYLAAGPPASFVRDKFDRLVLGSVSYLPQLICILVWKPISSTREICRNLVLAAISSIQDAISPVREVCHNLVLGAVSSIQGTKSSVWEPCYNLVSATVSSIQDAISSVWELCCNLVLATISSIQDAISSVWQLSCNLVLDAVSSTQDAISSVWELCCNLVLALISSIRDAISSVRRVCHNLVLDAVSSIKDAISSVWELCCNLVLVAISSIRERFRNLLLEALSSMRERCPKVILNAELFRNLVLDAISTTRELLTNLALEAILSASDLIRERKWSFLIAFGVTVYACIIGRTTAATRQEVQRQLIGAVEIVFSVIEWVITFCFFTLADLGVNSNYSPSIQLLLLLLFFFIAIVLLFQKDEHALDSSHGTNAIVPRGITIPDRPDIDYVPREANYTFPIRTLMERFILVNNLRMIIRPASLIASAARRVNQQYRRQNIEAFELFGKYNKRATAVFYFLLEAASFLLYVYGKNRRSFLLAAFLLSAFSFAMTVFTCIMGRTSATTRLQSRKQLIRMLEMVFSAAQLSVSLIYFILAELGVKNNFSASIFPLVFAIFVLAFDIKYDGDVAGSPGQTEDIILRDLPDTNLPVMAVPGTSNDHFPIGFVMGGFNPIHMIASLASLMALATRRRNSEFQFRNIQVQMPLLNTGLGGVDSAIFIGYEYTEANNSLTMLTIVISQ